MALVVGLDIGTRSIKGAVFAGTPKKFRLVDFFQAEIPSVEGVAAGVAPGPEGQAAAGEYVPPISLEELIQKTLAARSLKSADVIAAIDTKDCVVREIVVPFTRDEQIRKTVPYEAENYFHAFDIEEVVLEYLKTGETDGKSRLILFALRNGVIESRLGLLKRAGYDPLAIDLDAAALFNAFTLSPYFDPKKSALIVDMGATSTKIVLVEAGKLKKVRSLRTGVAVMSPERMIPEPAVVGGGAVPGGAGKAGGEEGEELGDVFSAEYSLEARFQEIESALRRLEPMSSLGPEGGQVAGGELEEPEAPIAILPDDEFARLQSVAEELGGEEEPSPARGAHGRGGVSAEENRGGRPSFPGRRSFAGGNGSGLNYSDYLERIGVEIQRTFATTQLAAPIEIICLTGGMSTREEARRYFSDSFDVETVSLDFGDLLPTDLETHRMQAVASQGAVAVGLALKGLGRDEVGIDFRKGAFRYEHRFERLKFPLLISAVLCLLVFLQTAFWAYHRYDYQSKRAQGFATESAKVFKAFFDKEPVAGLTPLEAAEKQRKTWEGKGHVEVDRFVDFVESVRDFGEVLNSTKLLFQIQNMDFDFRVRPVAGGAGKKSQLKGQSSTVVLMTDESTAGQTIEDNFRASSKYFQVKSDSRTVQNKYRVSLTLELKPQALAKLE